MIDFTNVTAIALGADDVLQIQDAVGTVLWQKTIYYNVNISAGSNGTVSVNGVSGDYSQSVPSGTVLAIEGTGNTGYNFNEWSDGNTDNPRTITVTGDLTLTASFASAALPNYFYVENTGSSDIEMSITDNNGYGYDIYKSEDQANWTLLGNTEDFLLTANIPANSKLYLKANANTWVYIIIKASGNHNIGGNIMSLLYGDNFENQTSFPSGSGANFKELFSDDIELISAANLILPATTLTEDCYRAMFQNCTSLATAPELPANTLANRCYYDMFHNCRNLTAAPTLPATTLADSCYYDMFQNCTSLATAPALPATTLADSCYSNMFYGCTALTTAPVLPATTLVQYCYSSMFQGCTSLTAAPALPATTLADICYTNMFYGCTALTTAPVLPATTLVQYCYRSMFDGCTNLNSVTTYANNISANQSLTSWLNNVAPTGTFYNMACTTYPSGSSGIPAGWTELHTLNDTINVTIHNVDLSVSGATYQIDGGTEQPISETGDGITEFTIPVTATDLTINGSRMTIEATGVCGYTSGRTMSVSKMSDNVDIDITSMM